MLSFKLCNSHSMLYHRAFVVIKMKVAFFMETSECSEVRAWFNSHLHFLLCEL